MKIYDVAVIGMGPAGISASIYAKRKGLETVIIGKGFGGQVTSTNEIENIIGIKETTGFEYSKMLKEHMKEYEIDEVLEYVLEIKDGEIKEIVTKDRIIYSKTVIIATGAKHKNLNIEGEKEFTGRGVHYCSTCDAPFYKGLDVAVVGGGNSGVEAAIELSNIAKNVKLIEFQKELKADKILVNKLIEKDNVEIITNSRSNKITGNDFVTEIEILNNETLESKKLDLDGIFIEIGLKPITDFVENLIELNENKEIIVNSKNETNIKGIFAAGDCTNVPYKQIVISVGEGAKAALSAFEYIVKK